MNERSVRYLLNAFDEDMEKAGYYRAPECEKCGGWRVGCMHEGRFSPQHCADASDSCPKCGGSGHVSMVALDVDVEALREAVNLTDLGELVEADWQAVEILYDLARQVLAALDADS